MDFVKQNYINFVNSFKRIDLKIFLILLVDVLFYMVFIQIGKYFLNLLQDKATNIDLNSNILGLNQQVATGLLSSVRGFFIFAIFLIILFLLLMIINWSLFKGFIWSITTNKKFNLNFFKRFFILNVLWVSIWFILILLFAFVIITQSAPIFMMVVLVVAFYFTNILYPLFLKSHKINEIKRAFKLGIKKIHYFIIPYAIIVLIGFVISKAFSLFSINLIVNQYISYIVGLILIAWMRYYFVEIVESIS